MPPKLVAHLQRPRKRAARFAIEYERQKVKKLRRSWRSACDAAGRGADVTPHTLRHTAVTWLLRRKVKMWEVAGYVGMSEKMVRDNYGHHSPDYLKEARDAL